MSLVLNADVMCRLRRASRVGLALAIAVVSTHPAFPQETSASDSKSRVKFASGSPGGFYYEIGSELERASADSTIPLINVQTEGAWDNLERLASGQVDLALTQLDTAGEFNRTHPDTEVLAIKVVFYDCLHIITRAGLGIRSIEDLDGLNLWAGTPGSGTERTSGRFLDMVGLPPRRYTRLDQATLLDLQGLFEKKELDGAFFVGAVGTPFIKNLVRSRACNLFNLDSATARRFLLDSPEDSPRGQMVLGSIPAGTYAPSQSAVQALLIPVVLMAKVGVRQNAIDSVVQLMGSLGKQERFTLAFSIESPGFVSLIDAGIPLHPSHSLYEPKRGWGQIATTVLTLLAGGALLWVFTKKWLFVTTVLQTHSATAAGVSAVLVVVLCAVGTYLLEYRINGNFSNVFEAVWSILVYTLSGLENRAPITIGGRVLAIIAMLMGPLLVALLTGVFASALVVRAMERRMASNLTGHYVILNWTDRTRVIIRQLHSPGLGHSVIAVLTDDPSVNFKTLQRDFRMGGDRRAFEDVFFSAGDPTDERALLNVNVQDAKTIIVVPAVTNGADERTIRSIVMLKKIAKQQRANDMTVIAEFTDMDNLHVAEELAEDFPGTLEVVGLGEINTWLLASAAMSHGLIAVYKDLLSATPDSNEIYSVELPRSASGRTFADYARLLLSADTNTRVIPIGLRRKTAGRWQVVLNPIASLADGSANPFFTLAEDDELIVIAYGPPQPGDLPAARTKAR